MADAGERSRFGAWLVAEQILTADQVDEAARSRAVYGGRLGTNLVEIGYLGLEELAEHLTRFHGLTLAPVRWLEEPDEKAIKLVPIALIRRFKLLPLHLERDALHVAMLDPADADQLDFVATAANRPVVAYVLPEIRLLYWLEIHLQVDRHPRFVNLATRLRRTDLTLAGGVDSNLGRTLELGQAPAPALASAEQAPELAPAPPAPEVLDKWFEDDVLRPDDDELLLEELVVESPTPTPSSTLNPGVSSPGVTDAASPARVAALEAQLAGASDRDAIVEAVLELARAHCEVAVLFLVNASKVTPFRAIGGDVQQRLEGVEVPVGVHSIFSHPAVTGFAFRGSPPEGGIDARLLESFDRAFVQDLLVQPIRIGDRVVNLLYCDNGSNPIGETSIAALGAVADCAARAYQRLILERKRERRS